MTTKAKAKAAQETVGEERLKDAKPLFDISRKILLAAIGAAALAQDEIEDFVNKLVERGEIAEKDGKNLMQEVLERRKRAMRVGEAEGSKHVQEILGHLGVPSKQDVEALGDKIAELTKRVEELKKSHS